MRVGLILLMLTLPLVGVLLTLSLRNRLLSFRTKTRYIENRRNLTEFKRVASLAMYGGLIQVLLLAGPILLYLYGLVQRQLELLDLVGVVLPTGFYLLVYVRYKRLEETVRNTGLDNPELIQEVVHVRDTWKKKSWPDW